MAVAVSDVSFQEGSNPVGKDKKRDINMLYISQIKDDAFRGVI